MLIRRPSRGMTLIELLIGMTIVAMLLAVGIPSFSAMIQNAQTRSAAESIVTGLQTARNEALRRNADVRFSLTDGGGGVVWTVDCVVATTDCPAATPLASRGAAEGGGNARVGISVATPIPAYGTALAAGAGMPAGVTFNNLGFVPVANIGADITRIDVTNVAFATGRRLVIVLGTGGLIRMCDPALVLSANPQGCA